ncbi:MAG: hypothetical protein LBM06_02200 [Prevotellaceae bacterium]|jgi:hypothetical protein|nr:hypothetical protein [Prevotellaceae bacterium]
MDERIKRIARTQRLLFLLFWLVPIGLLVVGESGGTWVGRYAADESASYALNTLTILLTIACVPVSLKLFAWVLTRRIEPLTLEQALRLYARWSSLRLLLLFIPVTVGLADYYLVMSHAGALCACIGLVASLFCIPGEARLRNELHIEREA